MKTEVNSFFRLGNKGTLSLTDREREEKKHGIVCEIVRRLNKELEREGTSQTHSSFSQGHLQSHI